MVNTLTTNYIQSQENITNPGPNISLKNQILTTISDNIRDLPLASIANENYKLWNSFTISRGPDKSFYTLGQSNFMPGVSTVNVSFTNDIEKKHIPNYDYSKVKHRGANSKVITTTTRMSAADHKVFITDILPILHVSSFDKNDNGTLYISNELLKRNNISSVVLESIDQKTPEAGIFVVEMSFTESVTPQKRNTTILDNSINAGLGTLSKPNASLPGQKG